MLADDRCWDSGKLAASFLLWLSWPISFKSVILKYCIIEVLSLSESNIRVAGKPAATTGLWALASYLHITGALIFHTT